MKTYAIILLFNFDIYYIFRFSVFTRLKTKNVLLNNQNQINQELPKVSKSVNTNGNAVTLSSL